MKTFQTFLIEARGIFNSAQMGKQLIHNDRLYDIVAIGVIDDWESFKKGKKWLYPKERSFNMMSLDRTPKFYTQVQHGSQDLFLVGTAAVTSPGAFPGWGWPTASKTTTIKLKPQDFTGITDNWMKVPALRSKLFKSIYTRADLDAAQAEYLTTLFDYYWSNARVKGYESMMTNAPSILRDYGEIVGAVWYIVQHGDKSGGQVFLPQAGNFPLIDSLLRVNGKEIQVSAKSGRGVSNTVKGEDILGLLNTLSSKERSSVARAYKTELHLLDILNSDQTVPGSIKAFMLLEPAFATKHKKAIQDMLKARTFRSMITTPGDPQLVKSLLALVPFNLKVAKGDINTQAGALSLMSKHIELRSKNMKFRELAEVILSGRVIYIHAKTIDKNGIIDFSATSGDVSVKDAYLRYKGTITRSADKIGLQLKI